MEGKLVSVIVVFIHLTSLKRFTSAIVNVILRLVFGHALGDLNRPGFCSFQTTALPLSLLRAPVYSSVCSLRCCFFLSALIFFVLEPGLPPLLFRVPLFFFCCTAPFPSLLRLSSISTQHRSLLVPSTRNKLTIECSRQFTTLKGEKATERKPTKKGDFLLVLVAAATVSIFFFLISLGYDLRLRDRRRHRSTSRPHLMPPTPFTVTTTRRTPGVIPRSGSETRLATITAASSPTSAVAPAPPQCDSRNLVPNGCQVPSTMSLSDRCISVNMLIEEAYSLALRKAGAQDEKEYILCSLACNRKSNSASTTTIVDDRAGVPLLEACLGPSPSGSSNSLCCSVASSPCLNAGQSRPTPSVEEVLSPHSQALDENDLQDVALPPALPANGFAVTPPRSSSRQTPPELRRQNFHRHVDGVKAEWEPFVHRFHGWLKKHFSLAQQATQSNAATATAPPVSPAPAPPGPPASLELLQQQLDALALQLCHLRLFTLETEPQKHPPVIEELLQEAKIDNAGALQQAESNP